MKTQNWAHELETGALRAAQKNSNGEWITCVEVKSLILEAFTTGKIQEYPSNSPGFFDKETLPPRQVTSKDNIRLVPGGTSIRRGAFVAPGVIIMPPSFINVGAYIDDGTMIDSHVLVGSCAQIGKRVHLSAGVQIGGVLEPSNARPVIIEDDVFVGADAVIVEGILVKKRAIIAPGVVLSKSLRLYDLVNNHVLAAGAPVPENAVVVSGTRPVTSDWGKKSGLALYTPIIVKYRDASSDISVALEEALRGERAF
jgi:2,3,4,5-tetrahydropyridine-2-carboxylate N-succinyltransferase